MTSSKDLKSCIRERQATTGESYSTARGNVLRERAAVRAPESPPAFRLALCGGG